MPNVANKNRCEYNKVFDKETSKKYRKCKNKKFEGFNCCYIHLNMFYRQFENNVIKIQSAYKGFYIRKKLEIYYKLPFELQRKISWHLNETLYLKHFHSSIAKLIYKRYKNLWENEKFYEIYVAIDNFVSENNDLIIRHNNQYITVFDNEEIINSFLIELYELVKLSIKYSAIINVYEIKALIKKTLAFTNGFEINKIDKTSYNYKLLLEYNRHFCNGRHIDALYFKYERHILYIGD